MQLLTSREKSGAEIFLKWFNIGAMVVGAGVGVASFGVAGLVLGPVIGAAAATLTGIIFQANPVDQWRAVVNKPPACSLMLPDEKDTGNEPVSFC